MVSAGLMKVIIRDHGYHRDLPQGCQWVAQLRSETGLHISLGEQLLPSLFHCWNFDRPLGRALLPFQETVSLGAISCSVFNCCCCEKGQHLLLGELWHWQCWAKEGMPRGKTSGRGIRVRRKKDENATLILWWGEATNLSKKGELIRVKFLFSWMSEALRKPDVSIFFLNKSGFATLFRHYQVIISPLQQKAYIFGLFLWTTYISA